MIRLSCLFKRSNSLFSYGPSLLLILLAFFNTSCNINDNSLKGSYGSEVTSPDDEETLIPTPEKPEKPTYVTKTYYLPNEALSLAPIYPIENIENFSVSPALPTGFVLDQNTGVITGSSPTPIVKQTFEVTAHTASGESVGAVELSVAMLINVDTGGLIDTGDILPGDGICDDGSGNCTLRAAVDEANFNGNQLAIIEVPALTIGINNAPITISTHAIFNGQGKGVTVLDADLDGSGTDTSLNITSGYDVTVSNLTLKDNAQGPAVYSYAQRLNLKSVVIQDILGGNLTAGVFHSTAGDLLIEDSEFRSLSTLTGIGFSAAVTGNGNVIIKDSVFDTISQKSWGAVSVGKDLYIYGSSFTNISTALVGPAIVDVSGSGITATIKNSEFRNNSSASSDGWINIDFTAKLFMDRVLLTGGSGRGIKFDGFILSTPVRSVISNTTCYNVTGYCIFASTKAEVDLIHVTLHSATYLVNAGSGSDVRIVNSILANGSLGNCQVGSGTPMKSLGHNHSDDSNCAAIFNQVGDVNNTPVQFDGNLLFNNGGPTETMGLLGASPAIDSANPLYCPIKDQREFPRPANKNLCDKGAFEL